MVNEAEWSDATSFRGRVIQRLTGLPLPGGIDFRPVAPDDGPFGAFAASRRLTTDGRVLLISTPGHTRGHASVIAVDDDGRHILLAGDATDTLERLHARRADAITPDPDVQVQTIDRILAHAAHTQRSTCRRTTPTRSPASERARRSDRERRQARTGDHGLAAATIPSANPAASPGPPPPKSLDCGRGRRTAPPQPIPDQPGGTALGSSFARPVSEWS